MLAPTGRSSGLFRGALPPFPLSLFLTSLCRFHFVDSPVSTSLFRLLSVSLFPAPRCLRLTEVPATYEPSRMTESVGSICRCQCGLALCGNHTAPLIWDGMVRAGISQLPWRQQADVLQGAQPRSIGNKINDIFPWALPCAPPKPWAEAQTCPARFLLFGYHRHRGSFRQTPVVGLVPCSLTESDGGTTLSCSDVGSMDPCGGVSEGYSGAPEPGCGEAHQIQVWPLRLSFAKVLQHADSEFSHRLPIHSLSNQPAPFTSSGTSIEEDQWGLWSMRVAFGGSTT